MASSTFAVIILGHGSRVSSANAPLVDVAALVSASMGGVEAVPAYLQLASPSLEEAVADLAARGCERVAVVPFFLYPGAHVTEDIPEKAEQLRRAHPGVEIVVTEHLGVHPLLAEVVAERVKSASERSGKSK